MVSAVWIENLIKVLDYENRLYGQLFQYAENKTGIVVHGEVENLQTLVGKEQKIVSELSKLKDAREQILRQISKSIGKSADELKISDILEVLPADQARPLAEIRDKLMETIKKLSDRNALNQKLLQNALEYVDFSLNLLTQPAPQTTQYGRKGNEAGAKSHGILDIKF